MWDAAQYLKYADERGRPFADLLARVTREHAKLVVDLGCGPGNLTRTLVERWPAARVVGVDKSGEMLEQAQREAIPGKLEFLQTDITSWQPDRAADVIVSNAALHWVSDHEVLLPRLTGMLTPGGVLAVQMPYHFQDPAHLAIEAVKSDPRWSAVLQGVGLHQQSVMPIAWYVDRLHDLGMRVDAWQTTYIHVLAGDNPVLEWFKGSALRPLLEKLNAQQQRDFQVELGDRFKAAFPARNGVTLLPFPRVFFVATKPA